MASAPAGLESVSIWLWKSNFEHFRLTIRLDMRSACSLFVFWKKRLEIWVYL